MWLRVRPSPLPGSGLSPPIGPPARSGHQWWRDLCPPWEAAGLPSAPARPGGQGAAGLGDRECPRVPVISLGGSLHSVPFAPGALCAGGRCYPHRNRWSHILALQHGASRLRLLSVPGAWLEPPNSEGQSASCLLACGQRFHTGPGVRGLVTLRASCTGDGCYQPRVRLWRDSVRKETFRSCFQRPADTSRLGFSSHVSC